MSREEYRRVEGFAGARDLDGRDGEPLVRYLLVNFLLLGAGMAMWTAVVAGLIWILF